MAEFTIEIKAMSVVLRDGKLKGSRKFVKTARHNFYVLGRVQHRRDICVNIAINKVIELGGKAVDVKWWDYVK